MKKREIITNAALASLAAVMVLTAGVGSADAYFTTYAEARGGYSIKLGDKTEIKEKFSEWTKKIVITSTEESESVWIRVKAFSGSTYPLTYTCSGKDILDYSKVEGAPAEREWYTLGDGYYYYNGILDKDNLETEELDIKISDIPENPDDSENFDVIVIYESTPVRYHEDGTAYADWSEILDSNLNNPEKDPVIDGTGDQNQDNSDEGGEG